MPEKGDGRDRLEKDMTEKFNVVRVRFHLSQENTLVIQGWKYGMEEGDALSVALDGEPLPHTSLAYDGMEVRQRYMVYDLGIEEEHYLYVPLPERWEEKKELELRVSGKEGERVVWKEEAAKLRKLKGQVDFFLEQVTLEQETCYVKGWAASIAPVRIRVFGAAERNWIARRPGMSGGT